MYLARVSAPDEWDAEQILFQNLRADVQRNLSHLPGIEHFAPLDCRYAEEIPKEHLLMENQAGVLVTVDIVIPRTSPSGSGWEVVLIQRGNPPHQGMWALPGGHVSTGDPSLEAAAQREAREETGIDIPLSLLQQVQTYEDFDDPRGKYVCLLYTLTKPLAPETCIEAGDDAMHACWYPIDDLLCLPPLAYNHIRLLRAALRQLFAPTYHHMLGMQEIDASQCEIEASPGARCSRTAYWRYHGVAACVQDMPLVVARAEKKE